MIGIIGAMDIEVEGFKSHLTDIVTEKHSFFEFTKGFIGKTEVVIVMCGIGKVSAAICAQLMIDKYSPELIINTGVAGGIDSALSIGDIAIADSVAQHDIDTTVFGDPKGYISNLMLVKIPVKEKIYSLLKKCADKEEDTTAIVGTIASGDQFISTPYQKNQIKDDFDAIAAEMEGGSIGHVCYANGVDFGIIRALSDNASGDAVADYESFRVTSAEKTIRIVTEFVKEFKNN